MNANRVLIMAGGTGGHIFPGLALAEALKDRGVAVHWLGARGGMECRKVAEHDIPLDVVDISGVRGKGIAGWLMLPFRLLAAVWQAMQAIRRNNPSCAVSFGGYVAGPGGIAAWLKGIPLVVHEQNRIPGLTNRTLARLARRVLQAFPGTFPGNRAITCGNPVRKSVTAIPDPESRFYQRTGKPRLLVTGGSQGASILNTLVPEAVALLPGEIQPRVCHQAGTREVEQTRKTYDAAGIDAEVHAFIDNMAEAYAWADLVICRSGALTVSELAAAGLGAILVPFPHAVDDHQAANASFLSDPGAALMLREDSLDAPALAAHLERLLGDRPAMLEMARKARSLAVGDATQKVVQACRDWISA